MKWKLWARGLAAAIIGGVSNSVVLVIVAPDKFSMSDLSTLGRVALATALVSAAMYLKQSPLPPNGTDSQN
jgi:hypothetical protein